MLYRQYAMKPLTKAVTVFAAAGAASAFVPGNRGQVDKLVPGSLRGDIDVVSFGIAKLSGDRGTAITALHVRETFFNRSDDLPWVIDLTAATAWPGGRLPETHPMLVNSDATTLPLLILGRGERRVADLYFPIAIDDLPSFSVTYRIDSADHRYAAYAMLGLSRHWPTREERGAEPGWGSHWWADPGYAWTEYRHRPGYAVPRPPKQIEVIGVPRAYYEVVPEVANDLDDQVMTECNEW
jgi:hypothetical protein